MNQVIPEELFDALCRLDSTVVCARDEGGTTYHVSHNVYIAIDDVNDCFCLELTDYPELEDEE